MRSANTCTHLCNHSATQPNLNPLSTHARTAPQHTTPSLHSRCHNQLLAAGELVCRVYFADRDAHLQWQICEGRSDDIKVREKLPRAAH